MKIKEKILEGWNIESSTKLERIDCEYIFLLEHPNEQGVRERRPHDLDKEFQPGDFTKLYRKVMNTMEILIRDGFNGEAFKLAFERVMQENEGITYQSIQGIEKKDNDVLITLEVPEKTDKGKVEKQFSQVYQARLEVEIEKQTALLEAEQRHSENLREIVIALVNNNPSGNPIVNFINEPKAESKTMTGENTKYKIEQAKNVAINEGGTINGQQIQNNCDGGKELTPDEVVKLLAQIEGKVRESALPESIKEKALKNLNSAVDEVQEKEPNQEIAIVQLKRMSHTLAEVSKTTAEGKKVWENVKPILIPLAGWLKVGIENFFNLL